MIDNYSVKALRTTLVTFKESGELHKALKELNPQFAKDKARDERIAGIENEVAGMKGDIAKILAAVTKQ
ncbi:hypothetical protein KNV35_gp78 [uncultured phage cr8_1]|uniref:Uncharacterized protein n=1 Tax=uncultured phage cr8_1 TaxID=2772068 RepID=A0A7M1RWQ1_9CAUD|nr:hypothetical protein KNV35_gp78 [uncultured phage cr8_1]QOR58857.1 hypothetical protein [uncultured phage cr8_1]